jgi:hypothetical protein
MLFSATPSFVGRVPDLLAIAAALGIAALLLGVLPREESIALLRWFRADLPDTDAAAIAAELGDLPPEY